MAYKPKEFKQEINKEPYSWVVRNRKVKLDCNEYMAEFVKGQLFREAIEGDYKFEMFQYVYAVALVQSRILNGDKVGYDSVKIFGTGKMDAREIKRWLEDQHINCSTGKINVEIPQERMDYFKMFGGRKH